jgi:hypothetical protein
VRNRSNWLSTSLNVLQSRDEMTPCSLRTPQNVSIFLLHILISQPNKFKKLTGTLAERWGRINLVKVAI